jgi:hypothetical protein
MACCLIKGPILSLQIIAVTGKEIRIESLHVTLVMLSRKWTAFTRMAALLMGCQFLNK